MGLFPLAPREEWWLLDYGGVRIMRTQSLSQDIGDLWVFFMSVLTYNRKVQRLFFLKGNLKSVADIGRSEESLLHPLWFNALPSTEAEWNMVKTRENQMGLFCNKNHQYQKWPLQQCLGQSCWTPKSCVREKKDGFEFRQCFWATWILHNLESSLWMLVSSLVFGLMWSAGSCPSY